MTKAPTLKTERLLLRLPGMEAWLGYLTLMFSERPTFMGGPVSPRIDEGDLTVQREVLANYGAGDFHTEGLWDRYLSYALEGRSPYYSDAQVKNYLRGLELSGVAIEQPEILSAYDLFNSHPVLDLPVHFITGAEDQNTPADLAHEYCEHLKAPAKSFTRIDGAAHMVMYDQPIVWAEALAQIRNQTPTN